MDTKLGKGLKRKWYRQLISIVLGCLIMASSAYAETKPQDSDIPDEYLPLLIGTWTPLLNLRDKSDTWSERQPEGGWWTSPIHASLLPDGKILFSGLSRRDEKRVYMGGDQLHTGMENGLSFVLDPDNVQAENGTVYVTPVRENPEPITPDGAKISDGGPPGKGFRDVLFCSGHAPIGGGRILYTGGSRIENLGQDNQVADQGLTYARLYDANTNEFSIISDPNGKPYRFSGQPPYNQFWYPTNTRLADGKVLTIGGFYEGLVQEPLAYNLSLHLGCRKF